MSQEENLDQVEDELEAGYKPPPEKSLEEIIKTDAEDESLKRYKAALLGQVDTKIIAPEPDNPKNVVVKKLALVVPGRPDAEIDLTKDLEEIKKTTFVIKEGIQFQIRIDFLVQREIVTGLKYVQRTSRKGFTVDKMKHMVGSYPPKMEIQSYTTPVEDAPSGLTGRGTYKVYSLFTDDDKNVHLEWEWTTEIKKDWQ